MKQRELWENQAVVTDRERIQFYLAQCRAILHGGGFHLLNATHPHSGANQGEMK